MNSYMPLSSIKSSLVSFKGKFCVILSLPENKALHSEYKHKAKAVMNYYCTFRPLQTSCIDGVLVKYAYMSSGTALH